MFYQRQGWNVGSHIKTALRWDQQREISRNIMFCTIAEKKIKMNAENKRTSMAMHSYTWSSSLPNKIYIFETLRGFFYYALGLTQFSSGLYKRYKCTSSSSYRVAEKSSQCTTAECTTPNCLDLDNKWTHVKRFMVCMLFCRVRLFVFVCVAWRSLGLCIYASPCCLNSCCVHVMWFFFVLFCCRFWPRCTYDVRCTYFGIR